MLPRDLPGNQTEVLDNTFTAMFQAALADEKGRADKEDDSRSCLSRRSGTSAHSKASQSKHHKSVINVRKSKHLVKKMVANLETFKHKSQQLASQESKESKGGGSNSRSSGGKGPKGRSDGAWQGGYEPYK